MIICKSYIGYYTMSMIILTSVFIPKIVFQTDFRYKCNIKKLIVQKRKSKSFEWFISHKQKHQPCFTLFKNIFVTQSLEWKWQIIALFLWPLLGNSSLFDSYDDKTEYEAPCDLHHQLQSHVIKTTASPNLWNLLSLYPFR